eukprot:GHUV01054742.1.p1 GENE.GHUV01054742.1~~GHUV01054742.1.p1  ORF type:complete len:145 (-),score=27.46 GHUV01054742.1:281-715(-)
MRPQIACSCYLLVEQVCTSCCIMQATISAICAVQDQLGVQDVSLLNFVVSDGSTLIATRFVRPEAEGAATLYYAEGGSYDRQEQQTTQQHGQGGAIGAAVATAGADDAASDDEPHGSSIPPGKSARVHSCRTQMPKQLKKLTCW